MNRSFILHDLHDKANTYPSAHRVSMRLISFILQNLMDARCPVQKKWQNAQCIYVFIGRLDTAPEYYEISWQKPRYFTKTNANHQWLFNGAKIRITQSFLNTKLDMHLWFRSRRHRLDISVQKKQVFLLQNRLESGITVICQILVLMIRHSF